MQLIINPTILRVAVTRTLCYREHMLAEIKSLIFGAKALEHQATNSPDRIASVAAALLIELAVIDGAFDADEKTVISKLLTARFKIREEDVAGLIATAEATVEDAVDLFSLTRPLREEYKQEERFQIIEMMWEVAFADGVVHDFEANLVRRATGLLNVSDFESGEAKKRVLERLDIQVDED